MKTKHFICLIIAFLVMSCESPNNHSNKANEPLPTDSLANTNHDSIPSTVEKPQSFETVFSVHDLFKTQNSDVINTIAQEDFELAVKKIKKYWPDDKATLTESQKANLRYLHIYAVAGLVTQEKQTHADLEKILDNYKGEFIITHHLEITEGGPMSFNQIQAEQEKPQNIRTTNTNNDGLNIHCFVNVELLEPSPLKEHIGKRAYLCGTLEDYKLSDANVYSWISELDLSEGMVKILEDEFEKE